MFEGGFEQSPVCLGFVHTVSGRFGLSNHTCLRWSKAFKVQAFEGPQRADKRTGYLAFARVPIRHFRAASRCFLPMYNSMELTTMEAASCLPSCRSSRLVQTFGAGENSLSIPSMQAFSAVLHVSALRPIAVNPGLQLRRQKRTTRAPREIIDIALRAPAGYRGIVFRILTLVLLVSALIVPRAAWGAHLSGHEDLSSIGAVHSHHHDHAHEQSASGEGAVEQDDAPGDLTHDHKPAFAVGGDIPLPEMSAVDAVIGAASAKGLTQLHLRVLSRPDSLLRPPRAI